MRTSTPTGCSPRDLGRLFSIGSDFSSPAKVFPPFLQVFTDERNQVFEKLLDAYTASLGALAKAQVEVNRQNAEITQLRGNLACCLAYTLRLILLLGLTFFHLLPASALVADALQGRIAELTAELEGQKKETARLQGVETEMSKTVRDLRAEMTAMKATHVEEIATVTAASDALSNERDAAVAIRSTLRAERDKAVSDRDAVRRDRDELIAKYEQLEKDTTIEAQRLTRRAQAYCDSLSEMDRLVSGKSSPILRLLPFSCRLS